jgi:colanic acid/amylovoran biosynthesis glycosyltransferase
VKIAYVINQYPKVSHSFIRREIRALERLGATVVRISMRGWEAEVVDPDDRHEGGLTRYVLREGALGILFAVLSSLFRVPMKTWEALVIAIKMTRGSDRSLAYHLIYWAEACVVARIVRAEQVTHLHAHFGTNPTEVAMLAGALTGVPFSFTVHGPEEFDRPAALGLPEKIRRAKFVVAISSDGRSQLFRWAEHAHWSKIEVVHCGIEANEWVAHAGPETSVRRFVCVGRLCEQKGQLLLVGAMRRLFETGTQCELVLAGDGEMRAAIEALIAQYGLKDSIRITGWLSAAQVQSEISGARALVLPSFAEGLPVVLMEAMALGKPVLSTYVAGIPELVLDGVNGWLFPAGDVEAAASAMAACLLASPERLVQMGQCARERAASRHNVDLEAAKLARLFGVTQAQTARDTRAAMTLA